jgi:hypothetical protein
MAKGSMSRVAGYVAPRLPSLAPDLNESWVREAQRHAIHGIGPLSPASVVAGRKLRGADGDHDRALDAIVDDHVRLAGAQGLVTSVGGALTAIIAMPANITGLALIQTRMVSAIAHLRGYDLDDPKVHDAVLACLLGEDKVDALVRQQKIPAPPMALATAPAHDPDTHRVLAAEVTAELLAKVGGKRAAVAFTRRVPIVGGVVGMGVDGFATWRIGDYAGSELRPRPRR